MKPVTALERRDTVLFEHGQVDSAVVEGGEIRGPVEAIGRVVADIHGQLEPGHVSGGQLQSVRQRSAAQPPARAAGVSPR